VKLRSEHRTRIRRRAVARTVDGMFAGLSRVGRLHPSSRPKVHGLERIRNVRYSSEDRPEHVLDIYRPAEPGPSPRPVVLYMHGGAFQSLSKDTHWLMGLAFARRGYVVFSINYRLAPKHRFPAGLQDACTAARWVHENAARWGGDPDRLVLAGESAGANLAATLALLTSYRFDEPWARSVWDAGLSPAAVSAAYGVFQVSDSARFSRRKQLPWFVDLRLRDVEDCYLQDSGAAPPTLADPLLFLESAGAPERPLPPFFLPVGTADPLLDDTRRMEAVLKKLGVPCEARYYPGEVHAFETLIWRPHARQCWRERFAVLGHWLDQGSGAPESRSG